MEYNTGKFIPDNAILKRFIDEDGAVFLEVRGQDGLLFRVTEGNRVYYSIKKAMINPGELTPMEDPEPTIPMAPPSTPDPLPDFQLDLEFPDDEKPDPYSPSGDSLSKGMSTATLDSYNSNGTEDPEDEELEEGQQVPKHLKSYCKKNEYGGYSLRWKKFLYILDSDFIVDVKAPNSGAQYDMEAEPIQAEPPHPQMNKAKPTDEDVFVLDSSSLADSSPSKQTAPKTQATKTETAETPGLKKGDILAMHLRDKCEQDLGGGGSRIAIGNYIYVLDADYRVITRMKVAYTDISSPQETPQPAPTSQTLSTPKAPTPPITPSTSSIDPPPSTVAKPAKAKPSKPSPPPRRKVPVEVAIANVKKIFIKALDKYEINADFFKETVFAPKNEEILMRAYKGDLAQLNDDTREAYMSGQNTVLLKEGGFSLFKAALIHELYIKTTLSGRGDNMKYFLSIIIAAEPDGSIRTPGGPMTLEEQKELVELFGSRVNVYTDKSQTIKRVYLHMRANVFDEFRELKEAGKKLLFKGYLLMKLYQQTTRLDRGDGITMIRLARDIIGYTKKKPKA